MKNLMMMIALVFLGSCAGTTAIYNTLTYPAKVNLKKTKYRSIEVADVGDSTESGVRRASFKGALESEILSFRKLKMIRKVSRREAIDNNIINRHTRRSKADLSIYGSYDESQGEEGYSQDETGQKSRMLFARGVFAYQLVDNKTGEVIHADTATHNKRIHKSSGDVYMGIETTSSLGFDVRKQIAKSVIGIFSEQGIPTRLEFKDGKKMKFSRVIELAREEKYIDALKEQNKLMKDLEPESTSDAYYNKSLLLALIGKKKEALKFADNVEDSFFAKDRYNLFRKIRSI